MSGGSELKAGFVSDAVKVLIPAVLTLATGGKRKAFSKAGRCNSGSRHEEMEICGSFPCEGFMAVRAWHEGFR
jgi:hypothetical protein